MAVGAADGVEVGVEVGFGVWVGLGEGVGVAVAVGVALGGAALAAMMGSSSGEYQATTRNTPRTKAMMDPMAASGSRRRHPEGVFSCDGSGGKGCSDPDAPGGAEGTTSDGWCGVCLEAAHSRAASARSSSGAIFRARSTYARLAPGSSLSQAIHSNAGRLEGSRCSASRKTRRASAFSPDRAASSPSLSSALVSSSIGTCLDQGVATRHPTALANPPIRTALGSRAAGPVVSPVTGRKSEHRRGECNTADRGCQSVAVRCPEGSRRDT